MSKHVEAEGGELLIKSSNGYMAIVPKNMAPWVKEHIKSGNHHIVDGYVKGLQEIKGGQKAEDGVKIGPPKDWEQFKKFNESLPPNLRDDAFKYGDKNKYDLYGMWESAGRPQSFMDVKDTEYFPLQEDGTYHGFSVGNEGVWLKPKSHPSAWMEYSSGALSPELKDMTVIQREDGRLQYVPKVSFASPVAPIEMTPKNIVSPKK
jgi:hypothetical protein